MADDIHKLINPTPDGIRAKVTAPEVITAIISKVKDGHLDVQQACGEMLFDLL